MDSIRPSSHKVTRTCGVGGWGVVANFRSARDDEAQSDSHHDMKPKVVVF